MKNFNTENLTPLQLSELRLQDATSLYAHEKKYPPPPGIRSRWLTPPSVSSIHWSLGRNLTAMITMPPTKAISGKIQNGTFFQPCGWKKNKIVNAANGKNGQMK